MRIKKLKTILTLALVAIATLLACKKEQPEMKEAEDPCACASEVSADFVIEENTGPVSGLWIETDTTLHNKRVRFRALEEDAEYTWYIGLDVETDQAPWKFFSDQWIGHDIPITLVVKKEPNNTCFPDDDGYDSITKTFHVSPYIIDHGWNEDIELGTIEGTYRVFSEELNDSIDITVNVHNLSSSPSMGIKNFNGSGLDCPYDDWHRGLDYVSYRKMASRYDTGFLDTTNNLCTGLSFVVINPINGPAELIINSQRWEGEPVTSNIVTKTYHYYGRRIGN
jgi:hypothetical protein